MSIPDYNSLNFLGSVVILFGRHGLYFYRIFPIFFNNKTSADTKNVTYFMYFLQAKDIDRTLIIFSHDIWDDEVNELINSVDFAKTLQIFYPYSIQTHTNAFPGESPNDCPRNAKKDQ